MSTGYLPTKSLRPVLYALALVALLGGAYLAMPLIGAWGSLLIGACLGLGALALVSLYVPELFLVVLLVGMPVWSLMPQAVNERLGGYWVPLTLALAAGSFVLHAAWRGRLRLVIPRPVREDIWLILFTCWLGFGIFWSAAPSYGAFKFLGFTANVLCAYLLVRWAISVGVFNLRRMATLLVLVSLMHVAIVIYIDLQIGSWGIGGAAVDIARTRALRQMGLNKIAESTAIAFGILVVLWSWLTKRYRRASTKIWMVAALLLQTWGLLNYQQRGPMVGLGMGIALLFMFSKRRIWQTFRQGRLGTLIVVALLVLGILGMGFYILNPSFHVSHMSGDENISVRFGLYSLGWGTFQSSPLRGVGTGGMGMEVGDGYARVYVHNLFLEIMAELGVVGLGLFLAFCGAAAYRIYRATMRFDARAIGTMALPAAAFLYRLALAMFSGDLSGWQAGVWVALIVGIYRIQVCNIKGEKSPEVGLAARSQEFRNG